MSEIGERLDQAQERLRETTPELAPYLTVQEVADRMRCEHRTVRRAIRNGELEAAMIGGRWLIDPAAVEEWFQSRRTQPRSRRPVSSPAPARGSSRGSVARLKAMKGS